MWSVVCGVWCAVFDVIWSSCGLVTTDKRLNSIACSFDLRSFQVPAYQIHKWIYTQSVFTGASHSSGVGSRANRTGLHKISEHLEDSCFRQEGRQKLSVTFVKSKLSFSVQMGAGCGSRLLPICHLGARQRLTLGPASTCDGAVDKGREVCNDVLLSSG